MVIYEKMKKKLNMQHVSRKHVIQLKRGEREREREREKMRKFTSEKRQ